VIAVLIGFTLGPGVGIALCLVALAADVVLVAVVRVVPWRAVPFLTAIGVAALAALAAATAVLVATRLLG
jgi:hypothetical protein